MARRKSAAYPRVLKFSAALAELSQPVQDADVTEIVRSIIAGVRRRGDRALKEYTRKFDGVSIQSVRLRVPKKPRISRVLEADMRRAYERVFAYHEAFTDETSILHDGSGGKWGRIVRPLRRAGIYVPGGTAPLFSSLIMAAAAARAAGVDELAVATPPIVNDTILAAARLCGIDELYQVGGAQGIAALAYGAESVKPVDKIVGPGNRYVTEAKRQVFGHVGIDSLAGPTEILILADDSADADVVAADMIAQAEHDPSSRSILATTSRKLADAVRAVLPENLRTLPRKKIAEAALMGRSAIVLCRGGNEMIAIADTMAAEHLEIMTKNPWSLARRARAAGAIFVGADAPEVLGDYIAGPNHILPTNRTARFTPPLSARDFVAVSSVQWFSRAARAELTESACRLARAEELEGHARSLEARLARRRRK